MFKPVVSDEPRRDGVTKAMVDDDNTTISFLGRGRSGEWNFEYFDPSIDFRFRFAASRNDEESPTAPEGRPLDVESGAGSSFAFRPGPG